MKQTFIIFAFSLIASIFTQAHTLSTQAYMASVDNIKVENIFSDTIPEGLTDLMSSLVQIANNYGDLDASERTVKRTPELQQTISHVFIVPFRGEAKAIIPAVEATLSKFKEAEKFSYNYVTVVNPETKASQNAGTWTDNEHFLEILKVNDPNNLVYIEVKDKNRPQMRFFIGIKWHQDGLGMFGSIYFIYSRRPDLILYDMDSKAKDEPLEEIIPKELQIKIKSIQKLINGYDAEINNVERGYANAVKDRNSLLKKRYSNRLTELWKLRDDLIAYYRNYFCRLGTNPLSNKETGK